MLFVRLTWCALLTALIVGSIQFGVEQWTAVPIIRAAEVLESQKLAGGTAQAREQASEPGHMHDESDSAAHDEMPHRAAWTWIANVLHGFSMALLMFAVMGWWIWKRGGVVSTFRLGLAVGSAGFLSLHLWPAVGLPAEIPGIEAAALGARQAWWLLASVSASLACALLTGIVMKDLGRRWRRGAALLMLALPFFVGAPQVAVDPLAGFSVQAHAQLQGLEREFIWTTHWISLSFWLSLGIFGGWVFDRWIRSAIAPAHEILIGHTA